MLKFHFARVQCSIYVEINLRYGLPPELYRQLIPSYQTVIGADAHSAKEVKAMADSIIYWQRLQNETH